LKITSELSQLVKVFEITDQSSRLHCQSLITTSNDTTKWIKTGAYSGELRKLSKDRPM